jgi:two-component system chemotaxis sensor kinase CheA
MRILVIDNDININGLIKSVLSMDKTYEVDLALSGKEGLKKLKSDPYDLALVDLTMPEVSGFDICQFMAADEDLVKVPVIIISAMPINDKNFQTEHGNFQALPVVKGLIEKPFDVHDLLNKIKEVTAK